MKAIVVNRYGGPDVLQLQEVPDPQPGPGEVLVKVAFAGVNFADAMQAAGIYPSGPRPPYIAGFEFAGTVAETGERVMGGGIQGAFAEQVAAPRERLVPIPQRLDFVQAAAFPVNYLTAYFAYWMADAKPDERVLIQAAGGGVGTAAVELGKIFGVETFGTSSSDEKLSRLKQLGLEHGINYATTDYEQAIRELTNGEGVDVVFEMLGGEHPAKETRCLRQLGRIVVYGTASGKLPEFDFFTMLSRNASVHALWIAPLVLDHEQMTQGWQDLSQWVNEGKLNPIIGHELPLDQAPEALRLLLERKNYGKVVLKA